MTRAPGQGGRGSGGSRPDGGEPVPFDLAGPLPAGVTLLEASAGTGKTYAIAALVARYVAQGTPLERLLVITFTRMATGELREKVRDRLVAAADALRGTLAGVAVDAGDDVLRVLTDAPTDEVARRHDRLATAVADFDAATIETTHGFCLHVLTGLGVAGEVERDVTFVEDVRDLLDEVVDDLYVRRFWSTDDRPPFSRAQAAEIGRAVLAHPSAAILPPPSDARSTPAMRGRLARAIGDEIERRKREAGLITFDDLLTRLDHALADAERGPAVARWLRGRYDIALVDEFQDTDLVQWDIMRRAFGSGDSALVLIGDPKQAIYAFRGADVYSYLRAAEEATSRATLATNWRSDQGLIDAYDALLSGSQLGQAGIGYRRVVAAAPNVAPRLIGAPGAPLRFRLVDRSDVGLTAKGFALLNPSRALVARDLAVDVVALLGSGAEIRRGDGPPEAVRPGHLAVLVRTNRQALDVVGALHDAGVPAVTNGSGSVFGTDAALQWLRLLEALERPTAPDRAASVAVTAFIDWSADRVAAAGDGEWEDLHWLFHRWAALLRRRGVAALLEHVSATEHLPARLLRRTSGERLLTDLRHVGQLLHGAAKAEGLGPTALTAWLHRRIDESDQDGDDEERSRRLESDAEAVQVLTIHRSKGLEFPIVYCPYLWDVYSPKAKIPTFHDPENGGARTIDVGGNDDPEFEHHCDLDLREQRGEDLRLLYVALTRARHQAVVWWAGTWDSRDSPLSRLLFDRGPDGVVAWEGSTPPSDAEAVARFEEVARAAGGQVSVERVAPGGTSTWGGSTPPSVELETAVFDRTLDERWRRTSYSGITAGTHDARVGSEPDEDALDDEPVVGTGPAARAGGDVVGAVGVEEALRDVALPLADLPGGVHIGTFIHRVLETADFVAEDAGAELRARIETQLSWRRIELGDRDAWVTGLRAMVETPLGPLVDELALRDFGGRDRIDEMGFELPLVGGDVPSGDLSVSDIADVLRAHRAEDDVLAGYADRLADGSLDRTLRGYLSGSLDLVLRLPGERFAIVDYKTNRLGGSTGSAAPTAWHYRRAALTVEMHQAHYPLQALLYTVALHRYLRWRLPSYEPSRQFAGVLYLFVRGMSSPAFPRVGDHPCGVWSWRPPARLIDALSDLFDRGGHP
ncbi:MAG: UvrD-helicase domain-containing protein [Acidimicrobiales bacterium]